MDTTLRGRGDHGHRANRPAGVADAHRGLGRDLLDASTLCAIATTSARGVAHVTTAYFALGPAFDLVWLSEPGATHSRNLHARPAAAIAVYDSTQSWGGSDRGIQLAGTARQVPASSLREAERAYAARFPGYEPGSLVGYRFYRFRPGRMKLFDEAVLGGGVFVTAIVRSRGRVVWDRTEVYRPQVARSG